MSTEHKLVLAGKFGWQTKEVRQILDNSPIKDQVIEAGYVPDESLALLTGAADALVNVSLYEGFGIPLVEAMACNVPIICSEGNALGEVAGNAGLKVDPMNVDEIASAMKKVIIEPSVRDSMILQGKRPIEVFLMG